MVTPSAAVSSPCYSQRMKRSRLLPVEYLAFAGLAALFAVACVNADPTPERHSDADSAPAQLPASTSGGAANDDLVGETSHEPTSPRDPDDQTASSTTATGTSAGQGRVPDADTGSSNSVGLDSGGAASGKPVEGSGNDESIVEPEAGTNEAVPATTGEPDARTDEADAAGSNGSTSCGVIASTCDTGEDCVHPTREYECLVNRCVPVGLSTCAGPTNATCSTRPFVRCVILGGDFGVCLDADTASCICREIPELVCQ